MIKVGSFYISQLLIEINEIIDDRNNEINESIDDRNNNLM